MALPTTYNTGTATVNINETSVVGQGTTWLTSGVQAGDLFAAAGLDVRIATVVSNTSLTLAYPWPGATRTAQVYEVRFTPDMTRALTAARAVLDVLTNGVLYAIAGLATVADRVPYFTGTGTAALATFTAFGRSLIAAASAAAARTVLGLAPVAASGSATDLTTGTLPDARLRAGLQSIAVTVTDLNTLTQTGVYKAAASATGSAGNSGTYLHLQYDASYAVQIFYHVSSALSMTRIIAAGVPGAWATVYNTAEWLNPVYAQIAGPTTDKAQSLGSAARRFSDVRASQVNVGGNAELAPSVGLNGAKGTTKSFQFRDEGINRFSLYADSTASTGGNTGTNLRLRAHNDDGTTAFDVLVLDRVLGVVSFGTPPKLPTYTVATVPSASLYPRCMIYVSNGASNKRFAISDGTNWRFPDGEIVS
ncbi:pyocin knob domain-containing protein [Rhizobium sp. Root483D2]|uniref:pyocin knob domain-containing protein n=1 Tax=Rhizobium sp. Root483D2 TaxID=1736545 RepID=UPI000714DB31|nr:pyocin knob domain-containing protein [Rhizobium sp. Root483D2]KQY20217.1 hypothetical protein ASD32_07055 [Rhizobium sp. Root483D2]